MKCPHCQISFHPQVSKYELGQHGRAEKWKYVWEAGIVTCPACGKPTVRVSYVESWGAATYPGKTIVAYPEKGTKPPAPVEVPQAIARDFDEASIVLPFSAQASAALSRRCLQHILAERNVSRSDNLSTAIDAALNSGIPSHLAENLDAVRNIGNFAAHPQKAQQSGEILPVEREEAEWNLEVLEMLFDFYYVQPARAATRREALNAKLAEAGKKPIKGPPEK